jgi:hypothetical protein
MHINFKDLTGQTFFRLTAISLSEKRGKRGEWYYECECICGNSKTVRGSHLTSGKIRSCGCYMVECTTERSTKHGHTKGNNWSTEYMSWRAMKQRCHSESYHAKGRYKDRGITVCKRWDKSFENFLTDMGPKPSPDYTLDRKDNDKGYYKSNCVWKIEKDQHKNVSTNRWIEYDGLRNILSDWARMFGVSPSTISEKLTNRSFKQVYDFYIKKNGRLFSL